MPARALLAGTAAGGLLLSLSLGQATTPVPSAKTPGPVQLISETPLPAPLLWVYDVRWSGEDSVFVSAPLVGLFELRLSKGKAVLGEKLVAAGRGSGTFFLPAYVGSSSRFLAFAAPFFSLGWRDRSDRTTRLDFPFAAVTDIDVTGDRLLILGAQMIDDKWAPDGAIAWIGSPAKGLRDLKAVFHSRSGPGARDMDACAILELGAVRFLPDGRYVIAPGVEPDIYLYSPAGKLVKTWQTRALGIDAECTLNDQERYRFSADQDGRWAWLSKRTTLEDILPLPEGPGLVVRSCRNGSTRWELIVLREGAAPFRYTLPVTSPSTLSHLRGDVRGDQVIMLLAEYGRPSRQPEPAVKPRLIRFRWVGL